MPKTKKRTKNKLLNSIGLNSTKGKLIVFMLIFAAIGGGVMIYKSYAATNSIVHLSDQIQKFGSGPKKVVESSGSKKGVTVWLIPGTNIVDRFLATSFTVAPVKDVKYYPCATVKRPSGSGGVSFFAENVNTEDNGNLTIPLPATNTYTEVCAPNILPFYQSALGATTILVNVGSTKPNDLYVSNITLKW